MTEQEIKVVDLAGELWNAFLQLPEQHPDDNDECRAHVHAIQNMIFAREGIRKYEELKK